MIFANSGDLENYNCFDFYSLASCLHFAMSADSIGMCFDEIGFIATGRNFNFIIETSVNIIYILVENLILSLVSSTALIVKLGRLKILVILCFLGEKILILIILLQVI